MGALLLGGGGHGLFLAARHRSPPPPPRGGGPENGIERPPLPANLFSPTPEQGQRVQNMSFCI